MNVKSPHVIWATVAIILGILTAAVVMILNNKDPSTLGDVITSIALPLLGALGVGLYFKVDKVQDNVNGNTSRDKDTIAEKDRVIQYQAEQLRQMALLVTPPALSATDDKEE